MEREVGGGIGMGNICKPMDVSFQCMTKSTTNKKKIKKKRIFLNYWFLRYMLSSRIDGVYGRVFFFLVF